MSRRRWVITALKLVLLVLVLATAGFVIWAESPLGPMPEALEALETDGAVRVESEPWFTFRPQGTAPAGGLIIYPGGRVDPRSYAPTARALAQQGYLVVIIPMPLNLAVFNADAATDVVQAYPQIDAWAIGGHSLGGAMAASYVDAHSDVMDGLILWASYPANDALATPNALHVLSIYATRDGLSTPEDIEASRDNLPPNTRFVVITGGNHAQFGWYGEQPGDGQAMISRKEQQEQIVTATAEFLAGLDRFSPNQHTNLTSSPFSAANNARVAQ